MKKVFVDTAIFRYASSVTVRTHANHGDGYLIKADSCEKIPKKITVVNTEIKSPKVNSVLADDVSAISDIAILAKNNELLLLYSHEVNLELFCHPLVDIAVGRFDGAPCRMVHSPTLKVGKQEFSPSDNTPNPLTIYPTKKYDLNSIDIVDNTDKSEIQDFLRDELLS